MLKCLIKILVKRKLFIVVKVYLSFYKPLFPIKAAQEVNLSMVWCTLAVGFAYKILMSLTSLYFEGEEAGERLDRIYFLSAAAL